MIRTSLLTAALAISLASAASAQNAPDLVTEFLLAGNPCSEAANNPSASAAIGICQSALVNIDAIKASHPSMSGHETNIYFVMQAVAHTTIGSKMGTIDGVRSARTCGELEQAWKAYVSVDESQSPANYAGDMKKMKVQAAPAVRLCRSEFGTPTGAPLLP